MNLQEEKNALFDEDFKCITEDKQALVDFCEELTNQSKILCCTKSGKMYEYVSNVYNSVVGQQNEMQNM